MDNSTVITKRLHISGLSSAFTSAEISQRLSTFGTVKSLDGFGLLDGLGQPRKFGYVTIETTPAKLAKCLNLLSGSIWKGAKFRLGEAKPDFTERLEREREAPTEPPKKKRRRTHAVEAPDMSLVTSEIAATRPGWKVTPLGRIIKPARMRPARPLPEITEIKKEKKIKVKTGGKEVKEGTEKKKRRVKEGLTRARRRTIDPTKWGSLHLKGVFLDVHGVQPIDKKSLQIAESSSSDDDSDRLAGSMAEDDDITPSATPPPVSVSDYTAVSPPPPPPRAAANPSTTAGIDLIDEARGTLSLIHSLFGPNDKAWGGPESLGSDVDEDEELRKVSRVVVGNEEGEGIEEVPMEVDNSLAPQNSGVVGVEDVVDEDEDMEEEEPVPPTVRQAQQIKLKDLFAPREDEGGFSLLNHLELDLELDLDDTDFGISAPGPNTALAASTSSHPVPAAFAAPIPTVHHIPTTLDAKRPLFFPHPTSLGALSAKGRLRDAFDVARENGWDWRDPAVGFYRTETEAEIKKRWEDTRGELTAGWKKRYREAGKVKKRRGGVDE